MKFDAKTPFAGEVLKRSPSPMIRIGREDDLGAVAKTFARRLRPKRSLAGIEGFVEGTGKHEGKLGSVIVTFDGVQVQVGSGFSDELRGQIWADQQSFLGRTVEIRYQEVTPDGSLRFPTFKCFRNDRD